MKYIVRSSSITSRTLPIEIGEFQWKKMVKEIKDNPNAPIVISSLLPESRQQRRYLEGGLIPLFVFFQGNDYTDTAQIEDARQDIMDEVLGVSRLNRLTGKVEVHAQSSKGKDNLNKVCEWLIAYLFEQYDCPHKAVDHEQFKVWRDTIYPEGGPDDWITYLIETGVLALKKQV